MVKWVNQKEHSKIKFLESALIGIHIASPEPAAHLTEEVEQVAPAADSIANSIRVFLPDTTPRADAPVPPEEEEVVNLGEAKE